jgi:hypothetical protein
MYSQMNARTIASGLVAATVVLSAVVGVGAIGALAAGSDGSIDANPNTTDAESTHTATMTVGSDAGGSSWNSLVVDYTDSGADVSNVGSGDVTTIGIDRGDDAAGTATDVDVSDDVSSVGASNDGETLTIGLGGNYNLEAGDELVVVFDGAQNPASAGTYTVDLVANQQSAAATATADLQIESDDPGSTDGNESAPDNDTMSDDESAPDNDTMPDDDTTSDNETHVPDCLETSVTFEQQTADETLVVDSVTLSEGGFVVIHDAHGDVIGHSAYLEAGTHEDVQVSLDTTPEAGTELTAMAHKDTNDNEQYDFGDGSGADGPYTENGEPVTDCALVTAPSDCTGAETSDH